MTDTYSDDLHWMSGQTNAAEYRDQALEDSDRRWEARNRFDGLLAAAPKALPTPAPDGRRQQTPTEIHLYGRAGRRERVDVITTGDRIKRGDKPSDLKDTA